MGSWSFFFAPQVRSVVFLSRFAFLSLWYLFGVHFSSVIQSLYMETIRLFVCWRSFQLGVSTNIFLEKWPCYFILPIRLAQFPHSYSKWRIFMFWIAFMNLYKAIIAENDTIMQFSLLMWRDGRFWTGWSSCVPSSMFGVSDLWHSCKCLSWFTFTFGRGVHNFVF